MSISHSSGSSCEKSLACGVLSSSCWTFASLSATTSYLGEIAVYTRPYSGDNQVVIRLSTEVNVEGYTLYTNHRLRLAKRSNYIHLPMPRRTRSYHHPTLLMHIICKTNANTNIPTQSFEKKTSQTKPKPIFNHDPGLVNSAPSGHSPNPPGSPPILTHLATLGTPCASSTNI